MSYEIVKSITIKEDKVFSRMESNNVSPKAFLNEENPGLTKMYNEQGKMGMLINLVEGGLDGYLEFQRSGNKLVRQLETITYNLLEDEKYTDLSEKLHKLEYKLLEIKQDTKEKENYKKECNEYRNKIHNYVDIKVREFFYPKLIIPYSIKNELDNVMEMYEENLENDDGDILSGTEDSYANEMLEQDIYGVLNKNNVEKIMQLNNNMYTLLNIDFRNKSYDEIFEQITDKLYEKFLNNINNLDEIVEVKETEKDEISEVLTI